MTLLIQVDTNRPLAVFATKDLENEFLARQLTEMRWVEIPLITTHEELKELDNKIN